MAYAAAQDEDEPPSKVLRVPVTQTVGFSEIDAYGNRYGMLVDYLNEIAKYTNWTYEYIDISPDEMIEGFLEGKYDLMGGTFYSEDFEKYFAYPNYSSGHSKATLLFREEDTRFKSYDLKSLNGATIGVYDRAKEKIVYLEEFLEDNGIQCQFKYYTVDDTKDGNLYEHLKNGEVDLLLGNDTDSVDGFKVIVSFDAQPYYIVTTVGNDEVLNGLNMALEKILDADPNFEEEHYQINYSDFATQQLMFRDEELAYIAQKKTLKVATIQDWHPFFCLDNDAELHNGIVPDLLMEISNVTGLEFEYIYTDTYAQAIELVQNGTADLVGSYMGSESMSVSHGLALSKPYLSMNSTVVKNKSVSYPGADLVGAIINGWSLPSEINAGQIETFDSLVDGLKAVDRGEVDFMYALATSIEPEIQRHHFSNIVPVYLANDYTNISFAVARPAVPELLTVLNKAINSISDEQKNTIVDTNIVSIGTTSMTLADMVYANPLTFVGIFAIILLMLVAFVLLAARARLKNSLIRADLEKAEAKSRAKGDFLSRMSHEIRTPMNAIVGLADLAVDCDDTPPKVRERLNKIQVSSRYLLSLINDILDMSRIDNGKMELSSENFSIERMLGEIEDMMRIQALQKNVEFSCSYDTGWNWLFGDGVRLRQVLVNLLSNAFKFTPAGGSVSLDVILESETPEAAAYKFSVSDTGVGIEDADQQRVFGAFEQVGSNYSKSEGTGLGLAISDSIVRLMGGELKLESVPGKGSRFYFTASFKKAVEPNTTIEPETGIDEGRSLIRLDGIHILLAEDNELNAEIAMDLLKNQGALVTWVENGQAAVDRFTESSPGEFGCILMDIRMPEKNGLEATEEIRRSSHEDGKRIPIIAMTANSFREDTEAAEAAGMDGFVPKPVDFALLLDTIRTAMAKREEL